MKRSVSKPAAQHKAKTPIPVVDVPMTIGRMKSVIFTILLILIAAGSGVFYLLPMEAGAGILGFPLDDAYIPLTFARTLAEHGSYAYHQLLAPTSGSTSPLYVFILALARVATYDFFLPSTIIGSASFAATAIFLFLLARRIFEKEQWLAFVAALVFVLIPRMQSEAVSGMPTLLFSAIVTASAYWYFTRRSVLFFVTAGLALWVRPDALIFLLAAMLHMLYHHFIIQQKNAVPDEGAVPVSRKAMMAGAAAFVLLLLGYFSFNFVLSGSLFPNSVAAKIAYYREANVDFLRGAWSFFATGPGAVLIIFAAWSVIATLLNALRRRRTPLLMAVLYLLGTIAAYWIFLPILIEGGRYLVPAMPFFVLLGVSGIRSFFNAILTALPVPFLRPVFNMLTGVLIFAAIIASIVRMSDTREQHYQATRYVFDRGAGAGMWLKRSAPDNAKVATHMIGSIGYYSECRIIDMRGIVTPELIPIIGNLAKLELKLRAEKLDFIATLREQFEVVNGNPVFLTNPANPEVMEVYPYVVGRTHVMSQRASAVNLEAVRYMQSQDNRNAAELLRRSIEMDPLSCRTFTLLGIAMLNQGDTLSAERMFDNALKLHPEYSPAMVPIADIMINRGNLDKGITMLQDAVKYQRWSRSANSSLRAALQRHQQDSIRALGAAAGSAR